MMWWHYVVLAIVTLIFFVIMFNAGYKQRKKDEWKEYKERYKDETHNKL